MVNKNFSFEIFNLKKIMVYSKSLKLKMNYFFDIFKKKVFFFVVYAMVINVVT
jgi:hypothetical protein